MCSLGVKTKQGFTESLILNNRKQVIEITAQLELWLDGKCFVQS